MAKQLDISSFFFKKPARAPSLARQDEEAPTATEAGMKRKTPTERHETRDDDVITSSSPDRAKVAKTSARVDVNAAPRTASPASDDTNAAATTPPDGAPTVRIPSADDSDPARREAFAKALGTSSSQQEKREDVQRRFRFLEPALVRDADGRRPNHPEYDERTLTVPKDMKLSPSQRQYWSIKSQYRDVILFFKVGKFYELYERDAEIGCAELDWKMTVSGVGHCRQVGCPEAGVDAAVARLVHLGYKVGRIEQLENAAQAKARGGSGAVSLFLISVWAIVLTSCFSLQVIRRQLAEVATPATRTDGDVRIDASAPVEAVHVLAFVEETDERGVNRGEDGTREADNETPTDDTSSVTVGYAFLDAAAGTLSIGSLRDDEHRVALATLLAQVAPAEVLVTRGRVSECARREIVKCVSKPTVTALTPGDEFPIDPSQSDAILDDVPAGSPRPRTWATNTQVSTAHPSARACAAAIKSHLRRLNCLTAVTSACIAKHDVYAGGRVRMDAATLANLELLCGSEGTKEGSLLARIECGCATDAGRRLLRRWIAAPMIDAGAIKRRQDAVWAAVDGGSDVADAVDAVTRSMRKGPDLERAVGRARGAKNASIGAVLPPHLARPRCQRRIAALRAARDAAHAAWTLASDFKSKCGDEEKVPSLLRGFIDAGDYSQSALETLEVIERETKFPSVSSSDKKAFKGPSLVASLDPGGDGDDASEAIRQDDEVCTKLLERFLDHSGTWTAAAAACATLDAVSALANFARDGGINNPMCRPSFVTRVEGEDATFEAKELWHPCAVTASSSEGVGEAVVPNDVALGNAGKDLRDPPAMLLTGPNMGGKSTLLRATCVAVVLAQMGAPVPAHSCVLSPADAVFARLDGAGDRIHAGESTFLVECAEASVILRAATRDSVVALDELGRGTSTFDGYAVAHASFEHLALDTRCRMMFATHYHAMSRDFGASPFVQLKHMAAHVADDAADDVTEEATEADRPITFLYKLWRGACPKSYGMRVAALAGVPRTVVEEAEKAAASMEKKLSNAFGDESDAFTVGERSAVDAIVAATDAGDVDMLMKLQVAVRERRGIET